MLGMLFLEGTAPSELDRMTFSDMQYWYSWAKAKAKANKPKDKK